MMTSGKLLDNSGVCIALSTLLFVLSLAILQLAYYLPATYEHVEEPTPDERFVSDRDGDFDIVIDADTGVTYLVVERGRGGTMRMSMCPLLNPDGTPFVSEVDG